MFELGHTQVGDGNEVGRCAEAASGPLGLLEQAVHGLDEGIRAVVDHAPDDGIGALANGLGQFLERLEPAAPGPTQPSVEFNPGGQRVVAGRSVRPRGQVLPLAPTLSTAMAAETISMP